MPYYDSARGWHVVRVVYDGPGLAGKTTNLKQLCRLVSARKRSELYTPAELKGRTMFFDWLEVDAPPQKNGQLKVQLITVPGQYQRNYRRRPLVEMADVVVFVCDSTQLPDTLRTFARLRASMKRRKTPLPILVQANKMDAPGAMPVERLRRRLRLEEEVPMIAATALRGPGVRETLATAIRIGIGTLSGDISLSEMFEDADKLFDHVLTFEDNPREDEPIDAEELNVAVEAEEVEPAAKAGRLAAASLDALEARARRAAAKAEPSAAATEEPPSAASTASRPAAAEPTSAKTPVSLSAASSPKPASSRAQDGSARKASPSDELVEVSRAAKHSKDSIRGNKA
jgi:signal recognition particle receptor subunit beta